MFTLSQGIDAGKVLLVILFHIFLALTVVSWIYTCAVDPGVPPETWQQQMAAQAAAGEAVQVCRRSGLYKPPRAHFDSVTERLTLNMDHFCPWVVNTVGFYNRKFFMLFLIYTNMTVTISLLGVSIQMPDLFPWASSDEAVSRWFPAIANQIFLIGSIVLNLILLGLLVPFMSVHLKMAFMNETTIEGSRYPKYNVGPFKNLAQVFGRNKWLWLCPIYGQGPDGDGVHWPVNDGGRVFDGTSSHAPAATLGSLDSPRSDNECQPNSPHNTEMGRTDDCEAALPTQASGHGVPVGAGPSMFQFVAASKHGGANREDNGKAALNEGRCKEPTQSLSIKTGSTTLSS